MKYKYTQWFESDNPLDLDYSLPPEHILKLAKECRGFREGFKTFEEIKEPESQERNNTYCSEHKVFNCRHPKYPCAHGRDSFGPCEDCENIETVVQKEPYVNYPDLIGTKIFHPQPQEKEECEYEDDELYIDPDKLFPPQPKQKPSEIIMEREFLLRYEKRKGKPWYISEDSIRSNARWEALLDFLDEYLKL